MQEPRDKRQQRTSSSDRSSSTGARWFLLGGSVVLVLWTATSAAELVLAMLPVVALMALNFYLHGRHLAERPANPTLITAASVLDIAVITVMILLWPEATQRGLGSPFFVMYYPVVLAFAFVMPRKITVTYTMATLAAYAGACFPWRTPRSSMTCGPSRPLCRG